MLGISKDRTRPLSVPLKVVLKGMNERVLTLEFFLNELGFSR